MKHRTANNIFLRTATFTFDLSPRELKLEFDQNIFHTKHLCEVTAKSVYK